MSDDLREEIEVIHVTCTQLVVDIAHTLEQLEAWGWREWAADCCLHCSNFPHPAARDALERLDTCAWLLHGGKYRDYLREARKGPDQ